MMRFEQWFDFKGGQTINRFMLYVKHQQRGLIQYASLEHLTMASIGTDSKIGVNSITACDHEVDIVQLSIY